MQHDRVEDLSSSQGAAIRYLLSAVSKNTQQTTLTTLEQFCNRSIEYHRFIVRAAFTAYLKSPSDERGAIISKLVTGALEKPNGLTILAPALDQSPTTITKESLNALLTTPLKLTAKSKMQMLMALQLGAENAGAKEAAAALLEGLTLSQAELKDDRDLRASALLARQLKLEQLSVQLAPACDVSLISPSSTASRARVSLAGVLRELGTGCVTTLADSRELLSIFPHAFTEKDVADVLAFFASHGTASNDTNTYNALMRASGKSPSRNASGSSSVVNAMPLLDALQQEGKFNWDTVIDGLDRPGAPTFRAQNISVIFEAYHRFKAENEYPAIKRFLGRWTNVARQRAALEYILKHPDKVNCKALKQDAPAELLPSVKPASVTAAELELWRSFAFVEAAVHVASRDRDFEQNTLLPVAQKLPVLFLYTLFLGSFSGTIKNFTLIKHLLTAHCPALDGVSTHLLPEAVKANQLDSIISIFSELTETQPDRTVDVLEMVLRYKPVVKRFLTGSGSPRLAVAIAMCMDEVQEPSDKWIQKALEGKLHFRTSSTDNRFSVAMSIVEVAEMLLQKQLYPVSATAALNALIASPMKDMLKDVVDCARALLAATNALFPEDVEQKATSFFKNMYAEGNTVKAVATMEKLSKSSSPQDKQLFACILNILFEECSAVSCYPMKELQLFAQLYGQLIALDLLPVSQQQRAWALLLPAAAKPANYAVEEYSVIALEQIKPRLADWPQYCRTLRYVKDLDFKVPGIMAAIHRGIRQEESAKNNNGGTGSPGSLDGKAGSMPADPAIVGLVGSKGKDKEVGSPTSKLHTLDIGTLLTNKSVTAPPRVIQEQINFLIGNTDMHNIENNARELSQLLRPEYYEYFADYLVVKRAALEPNYHAMYIDLVTKLQFKGLDTALRAATTAAVKRLLTSDKIRSDCDDPSERILLRNLGSWLGNITLEKSIPILQSDLCFKDLIFSGLHDGKLMAVVAFMARVLQSSKNSPFFCVPNPWTMAQLGLLMELYNLPYLRDTLRFEVELLCRNLDVSLAMVDLCQREHFATTRNERGLTDVYKELDLNASSDFRVQEGKNGLPDTYQPIASSAVGGAAGLRSSSSRPLQANAEPFQPKEVGPSGSAVPPPQTLAAPATPANTIDGAVAQLDIPHPPPVYVLPETVVLDDGEANSNNRQVLAAVLSNSVEKTFKAEAQRSIGVAVHTTLQFLIKDFARDSHPQDMLTAGEAMVRTLTASLCNVSVREPLCMRMQSDMMEMLPGVKTTEEGETLLARLVEKNMPLCQRVIEYRAGEQAAKSLRERLVAPIQARIDAVTSGVAAPLPPDQVNCAAFLQILGEELVPTGRMPAAQMNVYEDFYSYMPCVVTFMMYLRSVEESVTRYHSSEPYEVLDLNDEKFFHNATPATEFLRDRLTHTMELISPATAFYLLNPLLSKLMRLTVSLDELNKERNSPRADAAAAAAATTTTGPDGKPVAAGAAAGAAPTERKHLLRNFHVTTFMYQVLLMLLQGCVQRGGEPAQAELTRLYCNDDRRFMFPKLTGDLLRIQLLQCPRFDKDLSTALLRGDKGTMNFVRELLNIVLVRKKLVTTRDVQNTLAVLDQIARSRHNPRQTSQAPASVVTQPLSKLVSADVTQFVLPPTSETPEDPDREKRVRELMDEWNARYARMKSHRHSNEERIQSVDFVRTLQNEHMLDNPNLVSFFRMSVRLCVEHYANVSLELERENPAYVERSATGERLGAPPPHHSPYSAKLFSKCDGFTELVFVLLRCCSLRGSEPNPREHLRAETTLMKRVLEVLHRVITSQHDWVAQNRQPTQELPAGTAYLPVFQQQPYVRLISNMIVMIHRQETASHKAMSEEMMAAILSLLHSLRPMELPGFAFGWMELVAHRIFIPHCVEPPERQARYTDLLVAACRFIEFLTRGNAISGNGFVFYKTVFKLFLLLLHDFPSYLTAQHLPLCDAIPAPCDQLINLVMCAFPSDMRSFSPFDQMLSDAPEMQRAVLTEPQVAYLQHVFASEGGQALAELIVDAQQPLYRAEALSPQYLAAIREKLTQRAPADANTPVRWTLMNAAVLQIAITYLSQNQGTFEERKFRTSNVMQLFQYLCVNFDTRHRYFFLRALALQLRFPNVQTNLFAHVFFNLFLSSGDVDPQIRTATQEQITRVLGEKAMTSQPHPWGTLNTFVQLMRRPEFHFWEHSFVNAEGLQQQVFAKLHKSIVVRYEQLQPQQQQQQQQR